MDILSLSITLGHNDIRTFAVDWPAKPAVELKVIFRSVTAYNQ